MTGEGSDTSKFYGMESRRFGTRERISPLQQMHGCHTFFLRLFGRAHFRDFRNVMTQHVFNTVLERRT